ncbi:MAG: molybdopterin-dependent oxidoreductase [Halanaeroarchaeum sp.]
MGRSLPDPRSVDGAGLAILAGVLGVAGSYAAAGRSAGFLAVPVHGWEVDHMPAVVLRFSIVVLGELGDYAGLLIALTIAVALLSAVAWVALVVADEWTALAGVATAYATSWALVALVTGAPWTALGATLALTGTLGASAIGLPGARTGEVDDARRSALRFVGGVAAASVGYAVGNRSPLGTPPKLSVVDARERATIDRDLEVASAKSLSVGDLPGLVSSIGDFYEVDIDAVPPRVDRSQWSLSVTGAVGDEQRLSFQDLAERGTRHRFETLRCVGEDLNGHKMDTALWTGVEASALLAAAEVRDDATHVVLHAADGYDEEFPLSAMEESFLAFGMNGHELPPAHGAPVRALVPNRWGEVNVKWLTEIEVITGERTGYWEERGWQGTGPVTTVAKLHAVEHTDGTVRVGGHAYAGTRGIRRVEVSTDGGATWSTATLSDPLPGEDVWRMWAYEYAPPDHEHEVVVRAVDGTGTLQTKTNTAAFPSGATGWVSRRISP